MKHYLLTISRQILSYFLATLLVTGITLGLSLLLTGILILLGGLTTLILSTLLVGGAITGASDPPIIALMLAAGIVIVFLIAALLLLLFTVSGTLIFVGLLVFPASLLTDILLHTLKIRPLLARLGAYTLSGTTLGLLLAAASTAAILTAGASAWIAGITGLFLLIVTLLSISTFGAILSLTEPKYT